MTDRVSVRPARTASEYLLPLREAGAAGPAQVGAKAANLAALLGAGFPVPDGWVITAAAFQRFLAANNLGSEAAPETIEVAAIPGDVVAELEPLLQAVGDLPLAVRSSSADEDLAGASYAGQYETVLGVQGIEALRNALRRCWASAFAPRVAAYRSRVPAGDGSALSTQHAALPPAMAVLVQPLVRAESAGVAFTADPVSGDRQVVLVSAVRGLGERLVSGQATPDEWVVRDERAEARSQPEGAISAPQALEVAELARRVEQHFGAPQDVEWAVSDGQVYVLQARPITGLPQPPVLDIPSTGTWLKDTGHYPEPVTPFGASAYLPALEQGIQAMCAEFGLMIERVEQRSFGGEIYARPVPLGGKEGPAPPWWVLAVLARLMPPIRARLKAAERAVRGGLLERLPEQWEAEWRESFRQEAVRLRSVDRAALDDPALLSHLHDALDFLRRGQAVHFRLFIPYAVALHQLVVACRELLGWDTLGTLDLVAGLSTASSEPARALARLADRVRERPAARQALEQPDPDVHQRLAQAAPEMGVAFVEYLEQYAHRAISYDPGAPTLAERPALLAGLLRDAVAAGAGDLERQQAERRSQAEARARELLERRSETERQRFDQALAAARRTYPLREDNIFWTDNVPCGVIRGILLEAGRRLCQRGLLRHAEDAAYLELDELRAALQGAAPTDLTGTAARRRAEQAWVAAHPGPAFHGAPPAPPPDLRGLPAEARRTNGALMWMLGEEFTPREQQGASGLPGIPGSPGRYTGPVRVIRSEAEFDRLRPGEVLVCPTTTPTWSVLFANAGALVTDGGGVLSHAAIVAREHGVPAVLATGSATTSLKDGQVVSVDGARGRVEIVAAS